MADGDAIYAVPFNSFDVPADANGWLDKRLLQVADISAVTGLDYSLRRADGAWRGDDERIPDAAAVEDLVNGLESLRVTSAADIATASILEEMSAPPTLTVEAGGRRYAFRLYEIEDAYYIQRDDIPVFFSLSAFDYDRLNDVDAETLYPPTEEPGDADSAEAERDDNTGDTD